ncbi:MAG: hypothetical protein ABID64_00545 [Nitrospirota bacterium]
MNKQIPDWKQVSDTVRLVYLADVNLMICKKIYEYIDSQNRDDFYYFFLLSANNAFNESVGIIHSLLCSKKGEEVRIRPLLEKIIKKEKESIPAVDDKKVEHLLKAVDKDYPVVNFNNYTFLQEEDRRPIGNIMEDIRKKKRNTSGINDLINLKKQFEEENFHKIRHQAVAHKNKYLDDPAASPIGTIYPEYIEKLGEIIKELRINCHIWFDYTLINTSIGSIKALETVLEKLKGTRPE